MNARTQKILAGVTIALLIIIAATYYLAIPQKDVEQQNGSSVNGTTQQVNVVTGDGNSVNGNVTNTQPVKVVTTQGATQTVTKVVKQTSSEPAQQETTWVEVKPNAGG